MARSSFMAPAKATKKTTKKVKKKVAVAPAPVKVKKPVDVFRMIRDAPSLSISDLEMDKGHMEVWVLNIAASTHGKNSQVLVAVKTANGKSTPVTIPDTWIPVCLTTQVDKASLIGAGEFRAALAGNQHHGPLLRVIDSQAAHKILNFPEAQKETARISRTRADQRQAQRENPSAVVAEPQNLADGKRRKSAPVASGMVIGMTLNHKNDQLDEDQFLNTLKANGKTLKKIDLEYLTANSSSSRVKKWAAKKLGA